MLVGLVVVAGIAFQFFLILRQKNAIKAGESEMKQFCSQFKTGESFEPPAEKNLAEGFSFKTKKAFATCEFRLRNCTKGDVLSVASYKKIYGHFEERTPNGIRCEVIYNEKSKKITDVTLLVGLDVKYGNPYAPSFSH